MTLIKMDYKTFLQRYLKSETIFVVEDEDKYRFYTTEGELLIKAVVMKGQDEFDDMFFKETYFHNARNVIEVVDVIDDETFLEKEEEEEIEPEIDIIEENEPELNEEKEEIVETSVIEEEDV